MTHYESVPDEIIAQVLDAHGVDEPTDLPRPVQNQLTSGNIGEYRDSYLGLEGR